MAGSSFGVGSLRIPLQIKNMCTLAFIPTKDGYLLGMNRDEQKTRPPALSPEIVSKQNKRFIMPVDHRGGTWLGISETGNTFALLNWYPEDRLQGTQSRGQIIPQVIAAADCAEFDLELRALDLSKMSAFRLIGVFFGDRLLKEIRWNGSVLQTTSHEWAQRIWASSGFNEGEAIFKRSQVWEESLPINLQNPRRWMTNLLGSHRGGPGPFSICMHRDDAQTVSYSEVEVNTRTKMLRYLPKPLCQMQETRHQHDPEWHCAGFNS